MFISLKGRRHFFWVNCETDKRVDDLTIRILGTDHSVSFITFFFCSFLSVQWFGSWIYYYGRRERWHQRPPAPGRQTFPGDKGTVNQIGNIMQYISLTRAWRDEGTALKQIAWRRHFGCSILFFLARVIRHLSPSRPQHSFSPGVSTGRFRLIESGSFEISRISQVESVQFWSWQAAYRQPLVVRRVTQRCASHLWYRREKQLITSCLFVQFNNRVVVTRCPSRGHFYNTFHRRLGDQVSDKRRNIERRRRST